MYLLSKGLIEGIRSQLSSNLQRAFVFPVTLNAICVMSIAETTKIFAEDRREEAMCLTFENKTLKNAKGKILKYNGRLHSLNRFNFTKCKNTSKYRLVQRLIAGIRSHCRP